MRTEDARSAVLLATYNGEKYIDELLDSLLRQTDADFVCYIHDDGSTDGTVEKLQARCRKAPDRFRLLDGPAAGSAKDNFFFLMRAVQGRHRHYLFCDQDDVWLPDKVQRLTEAMEKLETESPGAPCLVFSDMKVADGDLSVIHESFSVYNHLWTNGITLDRAVMKDCAAGCSMMVNDVLLQNAVIQDTGKIRMHDAWLVILAAALGRIRYLDEPLVLYRQHGNNALGAQRVTAVSKMLLRVKRLAGFTQVRITREGLYERIAQLSCGSEVDAMKDLYAEMLKGAVRFPEMKKVERCRYILKYRLYQNRWSRLWTCFCA